MLDDERPPLISRRAFVGAVAVAPVTGALAAARPPSARSHVVVIGAGAFGGWTALALRRRGHRVTLVDAWGPGNARASSGGETRVIRTVYNGKALYVKMAARSMRLWRAAERDFGRTLLHRTGALWLCENDDGYVQRSIAPMRAEGLAVHALAPAEARRRFPHMAFDDVRSAYFEPEAGFLSARMACQLVFARAVREGVMHRAGWARAGPTRGGELTELVLSDGTRVSADQFVFACGPWMGTVFPDVVGRRIVATRQEVFFFGPPAGDERYAAGPTPVWAHVGGRLTYGLPDHDRRGIKVADDTTGDEVDPSRLERVPSADGLARARGIVATRFPALAGAPLVESRVCQYEVSTDGDFLIDRHPGLANTWLVGGGSGHGFKMGPAVGEHVAALVDGREQVHPQFAYARLQPRSPAPG